MHRKPVEINQNQTPESLFKGKDTKIAQTEIDSDPLTVQHPELQQKLFTDVTR